MFTNVRPDLFMSPEVVKAMHEARIAEMKRCAQEERLLAPVHQDIAAKRKFFLMYQVRHALFRLAPRLASRLVL